MTISAVTLSHSGKKIMTEDTYVL